MNIGILIHSQTGTTLKFGRLIADKLRAAGHEVELCELQTDPPVTGNTANKPFKIVNVPDCSKYSAVLVGGPVWAFSASPVALACTKTIEPISGKQFLPFVTMGFSWPFLGGNRALAQMRAVAAGRGAQTLSGQAVPKMFRDQASLMEKAAAAIVAELGGKTG